MTAALKNMTGRSSAQAASGPMIGAGYAKGLLEFAVSKGADRAVLLARAGLSAADVEDLDARVPVARYVALIEAAAALTGRPAIALQYGEAVRMQEISIVGLICEACERTFEVGLQLNRYWRLAFDEGRPAAPDMIRLVRNGEGLWMEIASEIFDHNPLVTEAEFARLVWNTRLMFADNAAFAEIGFPLELHFTHPEPAYRAEYDRVFGVPIAFGARSNALRVDERFLKLRQPPVNRYVFGVLSERAEALLKSVESAATVRGRVESLLIPILHTGDHSIEDVAARMGLSRQTLYRKLKAEGITFERLLDDLRHKMALHYLDGKKVSVNETAYLVGFSDPAAFSRAFKRWTGKSPRNRGT